MSGPRCICTRTAPEALPLGPKLPATLLWCRHSAAELSSTILLLSLDGCRAEPLKFPERAEQPDG
eukprot:14863346-Alexandrium_andersonii.AAC.1